MKKILAIQDEIEALLLKEMLEEREIPFKIQSLGDRAYGALWQHQYGCWGYLWAPQRYKDLIHYLHQLVQQSTEFTFPEY